MEHAAPYFLGEQVAELQRLEFQAMAWREGTLSLCRDAGIRTGHTVVDLGLWPRISDG
jgi:hypothetical protein